MDLSPDICYRALTSRDSRFDGRFFTGVTTTGIYCRPVCPAPKPKRGNVRYFACAAAAEAAGFRPCMRCRPEASPGTPAWVGSSTTVTRALRMIADGALDNGGDVDALAGQLGMGSRNLRRLFLQHLGASPKSVALTRRLHFAKTLLDSTALPVTEIAFSAGFSSIRRFNDAFKNTFGHSPSDVRAKQTDVAAHDAHFEVRLPYRPPFDWGALLGFLGPRAIPGVERVEGDVYKRIIGDGDCTGAVEVSACPGSNQLLLRVPVTLARRAAEIGERVRRLFDLGAFPEQIGRQLSSDPVMAKLVRRNPGLRVPGAWDPFETTIRAILGQQVTVAGATTIAGRVVAAYGRRVTAGREWRLFPTPQRLARARLDRVGIPRARAKAIRAVSGAFCADRLRFDGSMELETLVDTMTALDGVGAWTAHYVSMRAGGEPDAFPSNDLALRRAAEALDAKLTTERLLCERAEAWRPWRAYATMYLWTDYTRSLEKGKSK